MTELKVRLDSVADYLQQTWMVLRKKVTLYVAMLCLMWAK